MFKTQNFCHIASNNRNQVKVGVFVYRTTDDLATVLASGYFNDRIIDINLHDLIIHEKVDIADATKVQRNLLCVTERTLENVGTTVIKSKWEEDIESAVETIQDDIETIQDDIETIQDDITDIKAKDIEQDGRLDDIEEKVAYKATDFATPITTTNKGITQTEETALNNKIDLAANSGRMITAQGVWYAKMYAGTTAPAADDDTNYADFSQTDGQGNPIIVIYERQSGAWVQSETITPPAEYDGYVPITSKIWDIPEQAGQQGGRILWNHQSKEFTPYPQIISFENINVTGISTVAMPQNPSADQIVNKNYVDSEIQQAITESSDFDLFDTKWRDATTNNTRWLLSDGNWKTNTRGYQHLAADIAGKTLQSETISGTTIQFYLADDGHKICPASEETNATAIYNATGAAWYYILDTANQRFKLPRINPDKELLSIGASVVSNGQQPIFTNGSQNGSLRQGMKNLSGYTHYMYADGVSVEEWGSTALRFGSQSGLKVDFAQTSGVYKGKKYLYFYVGA